MNLKKQSSPSLPHLLLLAVFFLAGVILGQIAAGRAPDATGGELYHYLRNYLQLEDQDSGIAALSMLFLYLRYPILAFLLGFSSIGILLLPGLTVACGFFLSFSVSCFTAAFGGEGVLLALAVFGLRCAVTIPCYFLLAVPALNSSAELAAFALGHRRKAVLESGQWRRFGVVIGVLLAGVCVDLFLSPVLLRMTLERVLG